MTDNWTGRLSDYLDDELSPGERAAFEAHLPTCGACSTTIEELRRVIARAGALPAAAPAQDLWRGVEARLEPRGGALPFRARVARRFSFTVPQLVAAGLALMVMSGGAVWILQHGGRATSLPPLGAASGPGEAASISSVSFSDPRYDEAIADLQQTLNDGRSQLDAETIKVLEANIQIIDRAIEQSRQALTADPANVYLHNHLADARQRKLALLRRATELATKG